MNTSVTPSSSQEGISLSDGQRDDLIEQYTEIIVDSMDMDALIQYAQEQLANYFDKCSDIELKEDINNWDDNDGLYEELVDNVTKS
tara:strand:+ start:721 stop:978 length:258 start_codon:yes stop_codon:yes gene_type:complete